MSFAALAGAIKTTLEADTGSGGVFETGGANKLTAVYTGRVPQGTAHPYATITHVSGTREQGLDTDYSREVVQIDVWNDYDAGVSDSAAIIDRIDTVLNRVEITPTGFSATVGVVERTTYAQPDEEVVQCFIELRYDMERA